jgi:Domain of unknown function (DUF6458)
MRRNLMGIGVSVLLLAVGAILAFAVHATVAGLDIHVVGWILMGAGLLGLIVSLFMFAPRRTRIVTETAPAPVTDDSTVVRTTRNDVA